MSDPADLLRRMLLIADHVVTPLANTRTPDDTLTTLAAQVEAETRILREVPRLIDDAAPMLVTALLNLCDSRDLRDNEAAADWLRIVQACRAILLKRLPLGQRPSGVRA